MTIQFCHRDDWFHLSVATVAVQLEVKWRFVMRQLWVRKTNKRINSPSPRSSFNSRKRSLFRNFSGSVGHNFLLAFFFLFYFRFVLIYTRYWVPFAFFIRVIYTEILLEPCNLYSNLLRLYSRVGVWLQLIYLRLLYGFNIFLYRQLKEYCAGICVVMPFHITYCDWKIHIFTRTYFFKYNGEVHKDVISEEKTIVEVV